MQDIHHTRQGREGLILQQDARYQKKTFKEPQGTSRKSVNCIIWIYKNKQLHKKPSNITKLDIFVCIRRRICADLRKYDQSTGEHPGVRGHQRKNGANRCSRPGERHSSAISIIKKQHF